MIIENQKKEYDVHVQSSTNSLWRYYLMRELKTDITLTSSITMDDEIVNVSSGHGFVIGNHMVVRSGDTFFQLRVTNVNVNAITVGMPITNNFPITSSVIRGDINMNVDGSATPVEFKYSTEFYGAIDPIIPIDLETIKITMQHGSNIPDDGKFGGIAALTNGLYFLKMNSGRESFGNYINNQDFIDFGAIVEYGDKAPAGTNSTRITFDLYTIFKQAVRFNPRLLEYLIGKVRDDLSASAGISKMTLSLIGSFTEGE